jgi:hypothetical protein
LEIGWNLSFWRNFCSWSRRVYGVSVTSISNWTILNAFFTFISINICLSERKARWMNATVRQSLQLGDYLPFSSWTRQIDWERGICLFESCWVGKRSIWYHFVSKSEKRFIFGQ